MKFSSILVVCTGNVCRSPVAEALLKSRLSKRIESAGLDAMVGRGIDPTAQKIAQRESDLDLSSHKARQLSEKMIQEADLVLVMSDRQRREVARISPPATGKTLLFGHWMEGLDSQDIPDPFKKSCAAFEHVHKLLTQAADTWIAKLS